MQIRFLDIAQIEFDEAVEYYNSESAGLGALVSLRRIEGERFLAVIYKELSQTDGFIITAYFTNKLKFERGVILWQQRK